MDSRIRFKILAAEAAVYGMAVTTDGLTFDSDYKDAADQLEKSLELQNLNLEWDQSGFDSKSKMIITSA